jgi:hypothetical protein
MSTRFRHGVEFRNATPEDNELSRDNSQQVVAGGWRGPGLVPLWLIGRRGRAVHGALVVKVIRAGPGARQEWLDFSCCPSWAQW